MSFALTKTAEVIILNIQTCFRCSEHIAEWHRATSFRLCSDVTSDPVYTLFSKLCVIPVSTGERRQISTAAEKHRPMCQQMGHDKPEFS